MTKDVLLTISGSQFGPDYDTQDGPIEVITPAQYYFKNGKHYVLYDEVMEGESEITKNTLQFTDNYLSVTKHGPANVHMVIEEAKKNVTYYYTPVGSLHITLDGKTVKVSEEDNQIRVNADYDLGINYEHVANCQIHIDIKSKGGNNFSLTE